jgi:hypothetical protein
VQALPPHVRERAGAGRAPEGAQEPAPGHPEPDPEGAPSSRSGWASSAGARLVFFVARPRPGKKRLLQLPHAAVQLVSHAHAQLP